MGAALWGAVTTAFGDMLACIGTFLTQLITVGGSLNALLPLFAIGIAISLVMVAVKIVRHVTWGA